MINKLEVTATDQMPEDKFWELVEMVKWPCDHHKGKVKYLKAMDRDTCKSFRKTFAKAYNELHKVADNMELGVGDDGYSDLLHHIVGLGKKVFYKHCNDSSLIQKRADESDYKESYAYCIPYDSDYSDDGPFTLKHLVRLAKMSRDEVKKIRKMDIGNHWNQDNWKHLEPIGEELDKIQNLMIQFLNDPTEKGLEYLMKLKDFVKQATKSIEKFFNDNYMELPRKFTDGNGFRTALIQNTVSDASNILEFIKG